MFSFICISQCLITTKSIVYLRWLGASLSYASSRKINSFISAAMISSLMRIPNTSSEHIKPECCLLYCRRPNAVYCLEQTHYLYNIPKVQTKTAFRTSILFWHTVSIAAAYCWNRRRVKHNIPKFIEFILMLWADYSANSRDSVRYIYRAKISWSLKTLIACFWGKGAEFVSTISKTLRGSSMTCGDFLRKNVLL